jgi:hypothetical protein
MGTDYTAALTGLAAVVLVLTAMVAYVLSRPTDLSTPAASRRSR